MEEPQQPTTPIKKSSAPVIATVAVLAVSAIIAFASGIFKNAEPAPNQNNDQQSKDTGKPQTKAPGKTYKDGTYTLTQAYTSPGGEEKFDITLVIKDDFIISTNFTPKPIGAIGMKLQTAFSKDYQQLVVGKSVDEVSISVISGASLTSKAFMQALESIKLQAKA